MIKSELAKIGHNSEVNSAELLQCVERVERLEEQAKDINDDKSEVYKEYKSRGWDTKIIKKLVALRRQDPAKRQEEAAITDLYAQALGMVI